MQQYLEHLDDLPLIGDKDWLIDAQDKELLLIGLDEPIDTEDAPRFWDDDVVVWEQEFQGDTFEGLESELMTDEIVLDDEHWYLYEGDRDEI